MKDKYILDSSIWIELERKNSRVCDFVYPLIEKNQICLVDVIVVEVLRGTRSHKDFIKLQQAFGDFHCLSTPWGSVAELAFRVGKKGFHPPLIDLYIAQCTLENNKVLVTQDKHFSHISKVVPLKFELL